MACAVPCIRWAEQLVARKVWGVRRPLELTKYWWGTFFKKSVCDVMCACVYTGLFLFAANGCVASPESEGTAMLARMPTRLSKGRREAGSLERHGNTTLVYTCLVIERGLGCRNPRANLTSTSLLLNSSKGRVPFCHISINVIPYDLINRKCGIGVRCECTRAAFWKRRAGVGG